MLVRRHFMTHIASDASDYLDACARIRGISMSAMIRRLLETIAHDRLVLSILDDDSKALRRKGERSPRAKPKSDSGARA